jgi:hypothetical protein
MPALAGKITGLWAGPEAAAGATDQRLSEDLTKNKKKRMQKYWIHAVSLSPLLMRVPSAIHICNAIIAGKY